MIHTIKIQPAHHEACGLVSKQIMEYAQANHLQNWFGGSFENHLQGMLCMFAVDQVLYKLGKRHTFDASVGRTDTFDMTICGKRFEIKSGKVDSLEVLDENPHFMAQVPKDQFDNGRGVDVCGYIFPIIDSKMENCRVMGWIETERVIVDDYGKEREIINWTDKQQKHHLSYRIPFYDLNGLGSIC